MDDVFDRVGFAKKLTDETKLLEIFGRASVVNVIALAPTIVHALDALEKTFSKKSAIAKEAINSSADLVSEYRNNTLKFIRANYELYIDHFKFDVVSKITAGVRTP
jgi:hypothetical protein